MSQLAPQIGIGVMVFKDGKLLLAKRKGSHGEGYYAWPGGHLEHLESFEECAKREVMEETGIEIENVRFLRLSNLKQFAPRHYVDIGLMADWKSGEPVVREPEKVEGEWGWYDPEYLPKPLFAPCIESIEAYQTGKNYFDA